MEAGERFILATGVPWRFGALSPTYVEFMSMDGADACGVGILSSVCWELAHPEASTVSSSEDTGTLAGCMCHNARCSGDYEMARGKSVCVSHVKEGRAQTATRSWVAFDSARDGDKRDQGAKCTNVKA